MCPMLSMKKSMTKEIWIIVAVLVVIVLVALFYLNSGNMGSYTNTNPNPNVRVNTQAPTNTGDSAGSGAGSSSNYDIQIIGYAFDPEEVTIKVGDTITWTNMDSAQHTVVSTSGKELASERLSKGNSYFHTFTKAGTYYYYCTLHPSMKAKVIVQ